MPFLPGPFCDYNDRPFLKGSWAGGQAYTSLGPAGAEDSVGFGEWSLLTLFCVSNSYPCLRFSRSASSNEVGYEKCATLGGELPGERREKVSLPLFAISLRSL